MNVTLDDKRYPKLLKKAKNAPKTLYYRGTWDQELFKNCLAVVGSRRMTEYGKKVCEQLVFDLANAGLTIVSGFMFGIDITAHRSAVLSGGKTIAVMPCGIDVITPAYEKSLYREIEETALVVSEYPGNTAPKYWTFVQRNRIVAGLCKAVLVVEAAKDSGSLITAEYALSYKRKVFAVPGNVISPNSEGALSLIHSGKASLVMSANEILDYYKKSQQIKEKSLENKILELLGQKPMTINDMCNELKVEVKHVVTEVAILSISGRIAVSKGKFSVNKS